MGGVDSSKRSVGNSMTNSGIGGSNLGMGVGTIGSIEKTSSSNSGIGVGTISSIGVSTRGGIVGISICLSIGNSLELVLDLECRMEEYRQGQLAGELELSDSKEFVVEKHSPN